jgi:hypothetical protein
LTFIVVVLGLLLFPDGFFIKNVLIFSNAEECIVLLIIRRVYVLFAFNNIVDSIFMAWQIELCFSNQLSYTVSMVVFSFFTTGIITTWPWLSMFAGGNVSTVCWHSHVRLVVKKKNTSKRITIKQ